MERFMSYMIEVFCGRVAPRRGMQAVRSIGRMPANGCTPRVFSRPDGTLTPPNMADPVLKHWAIFRRPYGTSLEHLSGVVRDSGV